MKNILPILAFLCIFSHYAISQRDYSIPFLSADEVACLDGDSSSTLIVARVVDAGDNGFGTSVNISTSPGLEVWNLSEALIGVGDTLPNGQESVLFIGYRFSETFSIDTGLIIITLECADTSDCGEPLSDTIAVAANQVPSAEILASSNMFCTNDTVLLVAQDTLGITPVTFFWSDSVSTGSFLEVDTPGVYWVDITNDCGTTRDSITIHPGGVPSILFDSSSCNYASDTLITTVYASDISRDSLTFLWTNNSGNTITNGGDFIIETDSFSSTLIVINTSGDHTDQVFNASASNACGSSTVWNCSVALPISLIAFEGNLLDAEVFLSWSTATEINNDYFTIERSIDGENFSELAQIDGAGNSQEFINYEFIDDLQYLDLTTSTLYYRLRQTDFDGQYTYSDIIAINIDRSSGQISSISSAYIENEQLNLTFDSPISGEVEVELITMEGRQIMYHSEFLQFQKRLSKSVGFISSGVYAVVLSFDNQRDVIKIVK